MFSRIPLLWEWSCFEQRQTGVSSLLDAIYFKKAFNNRGN